MASELPKQYEPSTIEQHISDRWLAAKAFAAFRMTGYSATSS